MSESTRSATSTRSVTGHFDGWITGSYDVRGDLDLDGDVDATDKTTAENNTKTMGWEVLSDVGNRRGYAGYFAMIDPSLWLARNRVLDSELGRWLTRNALLQHVALSLYLYSDSPAPFPYPPPLNPYHKISPWTLLASGGGSGKKKTTPSCCISLYCGKIAPNLVLTAFFPFSHCWIEVERCDGEKNRYDVWQSPGDDGSHVRTDFAPGVWGGHGGAKLQSRKCFCV